VEEDKTWILTTLSYKKKGSASAFADEFISNVMDEEDKILEPGKTL
jgi:hypothetical protein